MRYMFGNLDWMNINKLLIPIGIEAEYIYIFIGMVVIYFLVRPFVIWVISVQSVNLLNYIISSLVFFAFSLFVFVLTSISDLQIMENLLQCSAIFGGCLLIIHLIQYTFRKNKKRA